MVKDFSSNEVTSSIGESAVNSSSEFNSRIINHVMSKYHMSYNEARDFVLRARGSGASNEGDYYNLARKKQQQGRF